MLLPMDALIGCISADENSLNDEKIHMGWKKQICIIKELFLILRIITPLLFF